MQPKDQLIKQVIQVRGDKIDVCERTIAANGTKQSDIAATNMATCT